MNTETIQGEQLRLDDVISHHGAMMQIDWIKVICYTAADVAKFNQTGVRVEDRSQYTDGDLRPCFCIWGTFVGGREDMGRWFTWTPSVGKGCGERSEFMYDQGNTLCTWERVINH